MTRAGSGHPERQLRQRRGWQLRALFGFAQILAHGQGSNADLFAGMRLNQVAAMIIDNVPAAGLLWVLAHVFRQEQSGEVIVVKRFAACDSEDVWPGRIHDLAGMGRQRAAAGGFEVSVAHPSVGGLVHSEIFVSFLQACLIAL